MAWTRGFVAAVVVVSVVGASDRALAFSPVGLEGHRSGERIVVMTSDHPAPGDSPAAVAAGLVPVSWRASGHPALFWSTHSEPGYNLHPDAAAERVYELVAAMAEDLGVDPDELRVGGVTAMQGWTTVLISQTFEGVPVRDAVLVATLREGQITSIRNELAAGLTVSTSPKLTADEAVAIAMGEARSMSDDARGGAASLKIWLPGDDSSKARLTYGVRVSSLHPVAEWTFEVDAMTGAVVAIDDGVQWADGEGRVLINAERTGPGDAKVPFTAVHLELGNGLVTDSDGEVLGRDSMSATYNSRRVRIRDQSGDSLDTFLLRMSGPFRSYTLNSSDLTQADPFVHLHVAKAAAERMTPNVAWVTRPLTANVNINDNCNAFWNGQSVNFFRSGGGCNNSGRIASIVYHEFGHGYHAALTSRVVGSIGEGSGDYFAATILDDPIVGRGFRANGGAIRRLDRSKRYPDDYVGQVHADGLIWGTAMWSLKNRLQMKYGANRGKAISDRLFVRALSTGPGISTAYAAIIAADDDDGNLSNGTPNACEINEIFGDRGMIDGGQINHRRAATRPVIDISHVGPGVVDANKGVVTLQSTVRNLSTCGSVSGDGARLYWTTDPQTPYRVEVGRASGNQVQFSIEGLVAGDSIYYYFSMDSAFSGSVVAPHFARVRGQERELYREDFEGGWASWTHGTVGDSRRDDWEVGAPHGTMGGPERAPSGQMIAATDLGRGPGAGETDGRAKPGRDTFVASSPIALAGRVGVRVEFWEHVAVSGTRRVLVGGREVFSESTRDTDAVGWRFRSVSVDPVGADAPPATVRFVLETESGNLGAGWAIDAVSVVGEEPTIDLLPPVAPRAARIMHRLAAVDADGNVVPPDNQTDSARFGVLAQDGTITGGCRCVASKAPSTLSVMGLMLVLGLVVSRRRVR